MNKSNLTKMERLMFQEKGTARKSNLWGAGAWLTKEIFQTFGFCWSLSTREQQSYLYCLLLSLQHQEEKPASGLLKE